MRSAAILAHEFVHADRAHGIVQGNFARNNRLSLLSLAGMISGYHREGDGRYAML